MTSAYRLIDTAHTLGGRDCDFGHMARGANNACTFQMYAETMSQRRADLTYLSPKLCASPNFRHSSRKVSLKFSMYAFWVELPGSIRMCLMLCFCGPRHKGPASELRTIVGFNFLRVAPKHGPNSHSFDLWASALCQTRLEARMPICASASRRVSLPFSSSS